MLIGRVIGDLTATRKHASHEGRKILLVQPLELDGGNRGDAMVALDAVGAGVGDRGVDCDGRFRGDDGSGAAVRGRRSM